MPINDLVRRIIFLCHKRGDLFTRSVNGLVTKPKNEPALGANIVEHVGGCGDSEIIDLDETKGQIFTQIVIQSPAQGERKVGRSKPCPGDQNKTAEGVSENVKVLATERGSWPDQEVVESKARPSGIPVHRAKVDSDEERPIIRITPTHIKSSGPL